MSAQILLNLLNKLRNREIICMACQVFYCFFMSLINSKIQEHE